MVVLDFNPCGWNQSVVGNIIGCKQKWDKIRGEVVISLLCCMEWITKSLSTHLSWNVPCQITQSVITSNHIMFGQLVLAFYIHQLCLYPSAFSIHITMSDGYWLQALSVDDMSQLIWGGETPILKWPISDWGSTFGWHHSDHLISYKWLCLLAELQVPITHNKTQLISLTTYFIIH